MEQKLMWKITNDYTGEDYGIGVEVRSVYYDRSRESELTHEFQIFDDDENLYYAGVSNCGDEGEHDMFAPLDDYGMPNAGAVSIKYKNDEGKFEYI